MNIEKKTILEVFAKNKAIRNPPIWLMRQAGRYMEQYRTLRQKHNSFLDLCYNADLACEITMQPIKRFGFDAAIIFSDILLIPHAMGVELDFIEKQGPKLQSINNLADINKLNEDIVEKLQAVYLAIKNVRKLLPKTTILIGFAGAPWTIATYMLEGGSSKDFTKVKKMAYLEPDIFHILIEKLITSISNHLIKQIEAGAEAIQIFDSWAGVVNYYYFKQYVIEPTAKIINNVRKIYPSIPIIGFIKGANMLYQDYINITKINAISLDANVSYDYIKDLANNNDIVIQGNLDPVFLLADNKILKEKIHQTLDHLSGYNYIFNLSHGVLKETKEQQIEFLVETVRSYK